MTWKRFPHYWPFVKGIHRWLVDFSHTHSVMQSFDVCCCWHGQIVVELPVVWDVMTLMWRHSHKYSTNFINGFQCNTAYLVRQWFKYTDRIQFAKIYSTSAGLYAWLALCCVLLCFGRCLPISFMITSLATFNHTIAPVSVKKPRRIWVNASHGFINSWCITTMS